MNTIYKGKINAVDVDRLGCIPEEAVLVRMEITEAPKGFETNVGKHVTYTWKRLLTNGMPKYGYGVMNRIMSPAELTRMKEIRAKYSYNNNLEAVAHMAACEELSVLWLDRVIEIHHKVEKSQDGKRNFESWEPAPITTSMTAEEIALRIQENRITASSAQQVEQY